MAYHSLYGRILGYDGSTLLLNGRPVGDFAPRGPKGKSFFVDSAIDAAEGESPETGMGTLDEAFAKCTANRGDTIYVMPNHAETVTGAGGITHDIAGVSVIGLGTGNQRPRFLMDAGTAVSYLISAADAYVENLVFASGHADVVTCFTVTAVYAHINGCEFVNNVVDENFKSAVNCSGAANTADGLKFTNNRVLTADAATLAAILCVDDIFGLVVTDNLVVSEGTGTALISCTTGKDLQQCYIDGNRCSAKGAEGANLLISNDTASPNNSGIISNNFIGHADATGTHVVGAVGGCRFFNNYSTSVDNLSGLLLPAADVNL